MTKKSFVIILILSAISTYVVAILDDLVRGSLLSGKGGLPFRFASGPSTDGFLLTLDIAFWFIAIWGIWKSIKRIQKK